MSSNINALDNKSNPLSDVSDSCSSDQGLYEDEFFYPKNVEEDFCRNFSCCGLILGDLHDLLQHYEGCHVKFEDDSQSVNISDSKYYANSWTKSSPEYNMGVDVPISFTMSSSNSDIISTDQSSLSDNISPSKINLAQIDNSDFMLSDSEDFSSTLELMRSSSGIDSIHFEKLYEQLGSNLSVDIGSCLDITSGINSGIATPALLSSQSSATASAENSPPLSPSLNTPTISDSSKDSIFDFDFMFQNTNFAINNQDSTQYKKNNFNRLKLSGKLNNPSPLGLTFGSSALSLYDDDIISALANSTDPLFLVKDETPSNTSSPSENSTNKARNNESQKRSFSTMQRSNDSGSGAAPKSKKSNNGVINIPASISAAMADAAFNEKARQNYSRIHRDDKPHRCLVIGCDKAYKNPNGLKYHALHGHCNIDITSCSKPYKCLVPNCFRSYKNLNGLKYHILHSHSIVDEESYTLNPCSTTNSNDEVLV
ncbi:Zinc finger protein sfp1 [Smittium culicis]|uniref:Zinc finger protein sfp1 n=1 Tax=Smittium culicis TaxID=133412 RepID=A0A1R1YKF7_9FUNG|nr:Zinc finger protein sfp1 [Smittium culicis]OMJ27388.1 Zinc finger protein sfp1 [Smittium culicis]